jgi:hypothetical protein
VRFLFSVVLLQDALSELIVSVPGTPEVSFVSVQALGIEGKQVRRQALGIEEKRANPACKPIFGGFVWWLMARGLR